MRFSLLPLLMVPFVATAAGNTEIDSFNRAKHLLETKVYKDHRVTLYCEASFDEKKNVILPKGFTTLQHEKRAKKIEWEHVVPAENFGRNFVEWREGDPRCVNESGTKLDFSSFSKLIESFVNSFLYSNTQTKSFKGRKCAEKVNYDFRLMQADLYNLYPAIGAVNAMRQNYNFQLLPGVPSSFGSCEMKIDRHRAEPPENARGPIARTYLYMAETYSQHFKLSQQQERLMQGWDNQYPVDKWECTRAKRIEEIQGNSNAFVKDACIAASFW